MKIFRSEFDAASHRIIRDMGYAPVFILLRRYLPLSLGRDLKTSFFDENVSEPPLHLTGHCAGLKRGVQQHQRRNLDHSPRRQRNTSRPSHAMLEHWHVAAF